MCFVAMPEVRRGGMAALRKPPPVRPRWMNGPHIFICNIKFLIAILKLIYACPDTNDFIIIGRFFSLQAWGLFHAHNERNPNKHININHGNHANHSSDIFCIEE